MAYCSEFSLTLSGHPFKLKEVQEKFIKNRYDFNIGDIQNEEVAHTPPTWKLHAEARWGANLDKMILFLEPYELSGELVDSEHGSDFFCKVWLENGLVTKNVNTEYMSDEHFEHCPDTCYWFDILDYALNEPEEYSNQIDFMLKHNIITQEYLDECIQKNK